MKFPSARESSWYVIQSNPRREAFVRGRIEDLGCEAFLPLMAERKPGRRRATVGPLFPAYLFARLSATDLARVRWTQGIRRVLGNGQRPLPVEDAAVDLIRSRADRTGKVRLGLDLRRGDSVKILDGPFAGLTGMLERSGVSPDQRVNVLLEVFHRCTRVEMPAHAIAGLAGA